MITFFPSRPVAVDLFGFEIHWYGLLYLAGFLLAYLLLPRLQHARSLGLSRDDWADFLAWSVAGVIVGGRLGYETDMWQLYGIYMRDLNGTPDKVNREFTAFRFVVTM